VSHTYSYLTFHVIWSTKNRAQLITPEIQPRLYQYIGGIIQDMQGVLLEIGGISDHVHLLVGLNPTHQPALVVQNIKRGSSLWINEKRLTNEKFKWQEGYGIFTVGYSNIETVQQYIKNQEEHHSKRSFEDEWKLILDHHGIAYNEKYVFG
jgi:putative transposase